MNASEKSNRIEKQVEIKAPIARVWRALTDPHEFGEWFRVKMETPFTMGKTARGHITHPGYEHLVWEVMITAIEPQHYFAFTWHPYAVDPNADYSKEAPTLVEFRLEKIADGTRVRVTESGFDKIPQHRFIDAMRMNTQGWEQQMENIKAYVSANP